ncbi:type II toxin-antitoxin system HicB family antitoxin [Salinarchaeum sp. IM2453]|uniref:type II toxin-antitoxin system HicB family antitoxin n=1 Tax=Salinarchaeum sp. IM2453 TaxID=2862870 RepID=UPI001C82D969|nr:type II toxin-antitoxin system HicB family antitoxin [Salinarchaeum sp. IM2453]QZA89492.1 type II toxin-antitoxin system HicB family antitoxin [Salinarchaeum sp. IM2453]
MSPTAEPTITLTNEGEWWMAKDTKTGVTSQGKSREAALEHLDEAVAAYKGTAGHKPTEGELKAADIDPERNTSGKSLPDALQ